MTTENTQPRPVVKLPPPVLSIIFMIVAFIFQKLWPIKLGVSPLLPYLGGAVIILQFGIKRMVSQTYKRASSKMMEWRTKNVLISTGIYAYSRNPLYLSFFLGPIGVGMIVNNAWMPLSIIPSSILIHYLIVIKEEGFLEENFGSEYIAYKNQVRRWL